MLNIDLLIELKTVNVRFYNSIVCHYFTSYTREKCSPHNLPIVLIRNFFNGISYTRSQLCGVYIYCEHGNLPALAPEMKPTALTCC